MNRYKCVYMRGGTSKAVFFQEKDLPKNRALWPELFMKVMGTPDVKQIDGMGGTVSSTSKVAVISPSERPDADVDYTFFQVDIVIPRVDDTANCGNISAAVGPYAVDEGLVPVKEPETVVRVFNTNTKKVIEEHVPIENGAASTEGDTVISGVPGTGAAIRMFFQDPGGAKTGKLFPTGHRSERMDVPGVGSAEVTIIDCANPVVFIRAESLGIRGTELTELNANRTVMDRIEAVRGEAAQRLNFVKTAEEARTKSTSIPKIAFVSAPQPYRDMDGTEIPAADMDICCRAVSVGSLHKAYPMTVAIATAAAARLDGTVVSKTAGMQTGSGVVRIGHSSGITAVEMVLDGDKVVKGGVIRTARRIMDGFVYVR